jgi:hypothetical protein
MKCKKGDSERNKVKQYRIRQNNHTHKKTSQYFLLAEEIEDGKISLLP